MDVWSPNRRALSWFAFAFPLLALSIFTWGVQYKLSLYDPPNAVSHQMPAAKLLSKEQRATLDDSPLLKNAKASAKVMHVVPATASLFSLLASSFLIRPASSQRKREEIRPARPRRHANLNTFFFRPPPTLA